MRKTLNILIAVLVTLGAVTAWTCTLAPKSECQDGSTKVEHKSSPYPHSVQYHCYNGQWTEEPVGTRH